MISRSRWSGRLPLLLVVAAGIALACFAVTGLGEGLVYYRTPTEVAREPADPALRMRVGGLVVPHSVHQEGGAITFRLV